MLKITINLALVVAALSAPLAATAQETSGSLTPTGSGSQPLEIESQDVKVTINNGIAVTTVTQVFRNNTNQALEAIYSFPIPYKASVSNFSMWINGKEMIGEVVEKARAREIYESITSKKKDPGLLEQVSFKLFQMRVFPVPANGTQKIQIAYYQPADYDSGFLTYVYPLQSRSGAAARVTGYFSVNVEIVSLIPIKQIASPSHGNNCAFKKIDEGRYLASVERPRQVLDRDFVLVWELERPKTGIHLLTHRKEGEDGYFMMTLLPGRELDGVQVSRNYILILDVSGSMESDSKLSLGIIAINEILRSLGKQDTFNIIVFNIDAASLYEVPGAVTDDNIRKAVEYLKEQRASGSTHILPALEKACSSQDPNRENVIVLFSDGIASSHEDQKQYKILLEKGSKNTRVFTFGIGNDVNKPLLNDLSGATGGFADFMSSQDDIYRKLRIFSSKIRKGIAEKLTLGFGGVNVHDVYPPELPTLYSGACITIFGRYSNGGEARITIKGVINGEAGSFSAKLDFPVTSSNNPEVRRMWALSAVESLQAQMTNAADIPTAISKIVSLGTTYSIVTPYTSFLVLESEDQYRQFNVNRVNAAQIETERKAQEKRMSQNDIVTTRRPYDNSKNHEWSGGGGWKGGGGACGSVGLDALLVIGIALGLRRFLERKA